MPLQNRVDPLGKIHIASSRGLFTGNRGVIHNPDTKSLLKRGWTTKAWIVCALVYKGHHREPMGRNTRSGGAGWTELFFLDEVTALAAGHRPCFACRRERAKNFALHFADAFAIAKPKVADMDVRLHAERVASGGQPRSMAPDEVAYLPDGAMIEADGKPYAVRAARLLPWDFSGYLSAVEIRDLPPTPLILLTPATTVAVLQSGYRPAWHSSAG